MPSKLVTPSLIKRVVVDELPTTNIKENILYDAGSELMLGGQRLVTVDSATAADGFTEPFLRNPITGSPDPASAGAIRAAALRLRKVALVGDSITEASMYGWAVEESIRRLGTYSKNLSRANLNSLSPTGVFVNNLFCNGLCGPTDTVSVEFDGDSRMRANVAGEGYGPWEDVAGGGFFHLASAGGQKGVVAVVRWRPNGSRPGPVVDTDTNGAERRVGTLGFAGAMHGALLRRGVADLDVRNYGIGGDKTYNILDRIGQIEAWAPDVSLLLCGINNYPDSNEIDDIRQIIQRLNAVGSYVVVGTILPSGASNPDATAAKRQADLVNRTLALASDADLVCEVVNLFSGVSSPSASSGAALVNGDFFGADLVHPNINGCLTRLADALSPSFNRLFPGFNRAVASAANAFDATHNPMGNLLGASGVFAGTGGGVGSNPAATGSVAASWSQGAASGSFASVVSTAPADASPISRTDGVAGNWQRFVCANAGTGGANRVYFTNLTDPAFAAGRRVRVHLTIRISAATLVNSLDAALYVNDTGGNVIAKLMLGADGNGTDMVSGTLTDSKALYLSTPEFVIPANVKTTGTIAFLQIACGCSQGGGYTLDMQDAVVEFTDVV